MENGKTKNHIYVIKCRFCKTPILAKSKYSLDINDKAVGFCPKCVTKMEERIVKVFGEED